MLKTKSNKIKISMKIKINHKGDTADISNALYLKFTAEKNCFESWLDSLNEDYELEIENDYYDGLYRTKSSFEFDHDLVNNLFYYIEEDKPIRIEDDLSSYIGLSDKYGSLTTLCLILWNYPKIIDKINKKKIQLGNLIFDSQIDNEFCFHFYALIPIQDAMEDGIDLDELLQKEFTSLSIEKIHNVLGNTEEHYHDIPVLLHTKKIQNMLTKYANKNNINDLNEHVEIFGEHVYMSINDDVFNDFADWLKQNYIKDYLMLLKKNEIYDNDYDFYEKDKIHKRKINDMIAKPKL